MKNTEIEYDVEKMKVTTHKCTIMYDLIIHKNTSILGSCRPLLLSLYNPSINDLWTTCPNALAYWPSAEILNTQNIVMHCPVFSVMYICVVLYNIVFIVL